MSDSAFSVDQNHGNFARTFDDPKYEAKKLVAHIIREVNRQKLTYNQLREVFQKVRLRCALKGKRTPRKLYILPTQADIDAFYSAIASPGHLLIFQTLEGTGLRDAELCNLEVSKINFSANTIFVTGKGNKDRIVIISNRLKEKLMLYLEARSNRHLFETNRNTKYTTRRIQQLAKMYKEKAGIADKQLTPHTFRHRFMTLLAENGVTKEKRALLAGHENDKTQEIYTHLSAGGMKDEVLTVLEKLKL